MACGADVEDSRNLPPVNDILQYPEEKDGERGVYDVLVPFGVANGGQLQDTEPRHEHSGGTDDVRELCVGFEVGTVERSADALDAPAAQDTEQSREKMPARDVGHQCFQEGPVAHLSPPLLTPQIIMGLASGARPGLGSPSQAP